MPFSRSRSPESITRSATSWPVRKPRTARAWRRPGWSSRGRRAPRWRRCAGRRAVARLSHSLVGSRWSGAHTPTPGSRRTIRPAAGQPAQSTDRTSRLACVTPAITSWRCAARRHGMQVPVRRHPDPEDIPCAATDRPSHPCSPHLRLAARSHDAPRRRGRPGIARGWRHRGAIPGKAGRVPSRGRRRRPVGRQQAVRRGSAGRRAEALQGHRPGRHREPVGVRLGCRWGHRRHLLQRRGQALSPATSSARRPRRCRGSGTSPPSGGRPVPGATVPDVGCHRGTTSITITPGLDVDQTTLTYTGSDPFYKIDPGSARSAVRRRGGGDLALTCSRRVPDLGVGGREAAMPRPSGGSDRADGRQRGDGTGG